MNPAPRKPEMANWREITKIPKIEDAFRASLIGQKGVYILKRYIYSNRGETSCIYLEKAGVIKKIPFQTISKEGYHADFIYLGERQIVSYRIQGRNCKLPLVCIDEITQDLYLYYNPKDPFVYFVLYSKKSKYDKYYLWDVSAPWIPTVYEIDLRKKEIRKMDEPPYDIDEWKIFSYERNALPENALLTSQGIQTIIIADNLSSVSCAETRKNYLVKIWYNYEQGAESEHPPKYMRILVYDQGKISNISMDFPYFTLYGCWNATIFGRFLYIVSTVIKPHIIMFCIFVFDLVEVESLTGNIDCLRNPEEIPPPTKNTEPIAVYKENKDIILFPTEMVKIGDCSISSCPYFGADPDRLADLPSSVKREAKTLMLSIKRRGLYLPRELFNSLIVYHLIF